MDTKFAVLDHIARQPAPFWAHDLPRDWRFADASQEVPMKRHFALVVGALGALAGCARNAQVESSGEVAAATPATRSMLPAGTTMTARLNQSLGTSASKEGDLFSATLTNAVVAQN